MLFRSLALANVVVRVAGINRACFGRDRRTDKDAGASSSLETQLSRSHVGSGDRRHEAEPDVTFPPQEAVDLLASPSSFRLSWKWCDGARSLEFAMAMT